MFELRDHYTLLFWFASLYLIYLEGAFINDVMLMRERGNSLGTLSTNQI